MKRKKTPPLQIAPTGELETTNGIESNVKGFIENSSPEMRDAISKTAKAVKQDAFAESVNSIQELEKKLGRKPTQREFVKHAFPKIFGMLSNDKNVVNAATGGKHDTLNPNPQSKLTDGKNNT